jgi:periplasmic divalent cation tolerance protein
MAAEREEAAGEQADGRAGGEQAYNSAARAAGAAFLHVQTTTDSRAEAMELAHDAVEARLAACAQVAGPVASTFWWEDGIERAEEWLLMLKLPADRYAELAEFLLDRHSYDEPEIIATPIIAGSAGYLDWIDEETRPH